MNQSSVSISVYFKINSIQQINVLTVEINQIYYEFYVGAP